MFVAITASTTQSHKMQQDLNKSQQELIRAQQVQGQEIAELKKQVGDILNQMNRNQGQGKLPAGTIPNPSFEQAKAITTRSGKVLGQAVPIQEEQEAVDALKSQVERDPATSRAENPPRARTGEKALPESTIQGSLDVPDPCHEKNAAETTMPSSTREHLDITIEEAETPGQTSKNGKLKGKTSNPSNSVLTNHLPPMPFPSRFAQSKKEESEKAILDTFRKVQVNIPLLDAIKQVPKYAKFLKELCTTRRNIREKEVVKVNENVSAVIQRKLPTKCKDPGSFTIPCTIGNSKFENIMLDLGASINVMSYAMYTSIAGLGDLKNDNVIIQLADRSNIYPRGLLEDVLVQVDKLIFPADFYVLDMEEKLDSDNRNSTQLLLGPPLHENSKDQDRCAFGISHNGV